MRKYYINMRNGWRMILDIGQYVLLAVVMIALCVSSWRLMRILGIVATVIYGLIGICLLPRVVGMFYNCIYYDEKTDELVLHRLRSKDQRIAMSNIDKIVPKDNTDLALGAYSNKYNLTFAVKSREGYDYFFISNCPVLIRFFNDRGVPTVERDKEFSYS